MSFIDALRVHPDGTTDRVVIHPDLAPVHEVLGHRTRQFRLGRGFIAYIAADAEQLELVPSYPATVLCHFYESLPHEAHVAGPMIIAELDPVTGQPQSLSEDDFSLLETLAS